MFFLTPFDLRSLGEGGDARRPTPDAYPNGLSPNGLANGLSDPLLSPLGGGSIGVVVIITREMELSKGTCVTSGLLYVFLDNILCSMVFKCKEIISNL